MAKNMDKPFIKSPIKAAGRPVSLDFSTFTSPMAWWDGQRISREQLLCDISAVLAQLPDHRYAINRCVDRYAFLVSFLAVALKGQINVLPANQLHQPLLDIARRAAGDVYCLQAHAQNEQAIGDIPTVELDMRGVGSPPAILNIDSNAIVAQVFTSGSTGQPVAHSKTWGQLLAGSYALAQGLADQLPSGASIVATVPPQHMFGLEATILLPLTQDVCVHSGKPFFPADVHAALTSLPAPRLLVTTPVHLRACLDAGVNVGFEWPQLAGVYSSTGPLSEALAIKASRQLNCPVTEIYGASETGASAVRSAAAGGLSPESEWRLLPDMQMQAVENGTQIDGPQLDQPVVLPDRIELLDKQRFRLLGRSRDVVKLAGKRISLGELNQRLNQIEGISDGVFYIPNEAGGEQPQRLQAIVVAGQISDAEIRKQLAQYIDPVFLPRPIIRVPRLPRNETGKLSQAALQALLK